MAGVLHMDMAHPAVFHGAKENAPFPFLHPILLLDGIVQGVSEKGTEIPRPDEGKGRPVNQEREIDVPFPALAHLFRQKIVQGLVSALDHGVVDVHLLFQILQLSLLASTVRALKFHQTMLQVMGEHVDALHVLSRHTVVACLGLKPHLKFPVSLLEPRISEDAELDEENHAGEDGGIELVDHGDRTVLENVAVEMANIDSQDDHDGQEGHRKEKGGDSRDALQVLDAKLAEDQKVEEGIEDDIDGRKDEKIGDVVILVGKRDAGKTHDKPVEMVSEILDDHGSRPKEQRPEDIQLERKQDQKEGKKIAEKIVEKDADRLGEERESIGRSEKDADGQFDGKLRKQPKPKSLLAWKAIEHQCQRHDELHEKADHFLSP